MKRNNSLRVFITIICMTVFLILIVAGIVYVRTLGRTLIQFDIHQNPEMIRLSTFAEPPQFAIWIENSRTGQLKTVFVTSRVSKGDWEGKPSVPVALPRWFGLFRGENKPFDFMTDNKYMAVSGATPKEDYFSVRVEVKSGSSWICWIEVNLAGDFNDEFREFDIQTLKEDEFSCGQPALLYKASVNAIKGFTCNPSLIAQSVWENGKNRLEPVSAGVTTARNVFDKIKITVIQPTPKLIDKNKILYY
jgi:hypothetical protein